MCLCSICESYGCIKKNKKVYFSQVENDYVSDYLDYAATHNEHYLFAIITVIIKYLCIGIQILVVFVIGVLLIPVVYAAGGVLLSIIVIATPLILLGIVMYGIFICLKYSYLALTNGLCSFVKSIPEPSNDYNCGRNANSQNPVNLV